MGSGAADLDDKPGSHDLSPGQITARRWQLHVTAATVFGIDQLTKYWALRALDGGDSFDGPLGSGLRLVRNTGSAFSLGAGFGPVFGAIALLVAISLFWIVRRIESRTVVVGLGLIQGGALGNVADRLFREGDGLLGGAVIDWIEAGSWWPVFNLADAAIVVGGLIVVVAGSRE